MKIFLKPRAIAAASLSVALAGWGGGCASSGGASAGAVVGPGMEGAQARNFYAEWYDASAVVLPPPPAPATAKTKR